MINKVQINKAVEKIVEVFSPSQVVLFGSYANGTATEDSDLDLLVVQESDLPRHRRSFEIRKTLRSLNLPLDLIVFTPAEMKEWSDLSYAFVNQALKTGRVLYHEKS